jgi:uncharacterized damage-inducible protein DinB
MIRTISDFEHSWSAEIESTQKVFKHLTNESLSKQIHPDVRTLGRLAWHIVTTIPEMTGRMGLKTAGPGEHDPIPATAKEILAGYSTAAISLLDEVKKNWKDETLEVEDDMYGEKWKRGSSLGGFIKHEIHHRAQMIVLMRQLGLAVPGIYGPTRDEWKQYGMNAPEV